MPHETKLNHEILCVYTDYLVYLNLEEENNAASTLKNNRCKSINHPFLTTYYLPKNVYKQKYYDLQ